MNPAGGRDACLVKINDCDAPGRPAVILGDSIVCAGSVIQYALAPDSLASRYHWLMAEGWEGSSDSNSIEVKVGSEGGHIQVYALSACGGISDTKSLEVQVWPLPEPKIQEKESILSATQTYTSYQWYLNGQAIEGAGSALHIPIANGAYTLSVTDENGCIGQSDTVWIEGLGIQNLSAIPGLSVYPNPVYTLLYVQSERDGILSIRDIAGKTVGSTIQLMPGSNSIDVQALPAGIYILTCTTSGGRSIFKMTKQ